MTATSKNRSQLISARTWYLVRHGQTEWNVASRMQGQLDSPLTSLGRHQMQASADLLFRLGVDMFFASHLGRTRDSVAIMNERLALPVCFDDRLKEWSAGAWSGEFHAEIPTKWPAEWTAWAADPVTCPSPEGESFLDLRDRAASFVRDALASTSHLRLGVVAHGFINRALAGVLLSQAPGETAAIRQNNDTVIRIIQRADGSVADYFTNGVGPSPGLPTAIRSFSSIA